MVEEIIGPLTSVVPLMADSLTDNPDSICLKIFSTITMALSTSIPAPRAKPPSVMIFSVSPEKYINANVATIETGSTKLTMAVIPILRRNRNKISIERMAPIIALLFSSSMALCINLP